MQPSPAFEDLYLDSAWVTIGSFDGVHRGHQQIIRKLVSEAHSSGAPAVVVTFFPHPAVVLRGLQGPFFLTTPDERAALLEKLGIDYVVTLPFDKQMAMQTAEEFMTAIKTHLGLKKLVVGYNFALGRGRQGDISTLTALGEKMGYSVEVMSPVEIDGEVISSSRIRALLNQGDVSSAADLLGRPYKVAGEVTHGDGRGHGLGIPTANLSVWPERLVPAVGVYATWASYRGKRYASVTNIGIRPTFENDPVLPRIETHLLDFDRDLYGQPLELEFVQHLRREQRFPSIQILLDQIHQDILQAREVLIDAP
jgi:riboflavin kinase / FMN adenylyltransferase